MKKIINSIKEEMENLDYLIRFLEKEADNPESIVIPDDLEQKRMLFRSLCNVREPKKVSPEFLEAQDAELQIQLMEKGVVELSEIRESFYGGKMLLWRGDITRLHVDVIVNAANSTLLGCFIPMHHCIDNAIHSAAGVQLRLKCSDIMGAQGRPEPVGCAKITRGYNLPAKFVLHTVGPVCGDGNPSRRQCAELAACYRSCMEIADMRTFSSIAFCCISTGVYGFPQKKAAEIAVKTVKSYMESRQLIKSVVFNVFKPEDEEIYRGVLTEFAK